MGAELSGAGRSRRASENPTIIDLAPLTAEQRAAGVRTLAGILADQVMTELRESANDNVPQGRQK